MTDTSATTLEHADIHEILALLPHRYPFLLVDKVRDIDEDNAAIGVKNITISDPVFQGHFPDKPVYPGVLLVEGMAQTAGAICIKARQMDGPPPIVYFMTIDKCKFRKPVLPGDVVEYHVEKIRSKGAIWKFAAKAMVDGHKCAEAEISAMLVLNQPKDATS